MSREKQLLNQIAKLEESKAIANDKADFNTFSTICQDIRELERQLKSLRYELYQAERMVSK